MLNKSRQELASILTWMTFCCLASAMRYDSRPLLAFPRAAMTQAIVRASPPTQPLHPRASSPGRATQATSAAHRGTEEYSTCAWDAGSLLWPCTTHSQLQHVHVCCGTHPKSHYLKQSLSMVKCADTCCRRKNSQLAASLQVVRGFEILCCSR